MNQVHHPTPIVLKNISLIAVTSGEEDECIKALEYSSRYIDFGEIILFTDKQIKHKNIRVVGAPKFNNISEWGRFIVFDLYKFIKTDYVLLVHPDGFVVNPSKWSDDFLQFDYIGAPWRLPKDRISFRDHYGNIIRVGNSVSLRSKRLLSLPSKIGLEWCDFDGDVPHEDGFICVQHRHTFVENHGIKYAPLNIAMHFGREHPIEIPYTSEPFTFHKWHGHNAKYPNFNRWKYFQKRLYRLFRKFGKFV